MKRFFAVLISLITVISAVIIFPHAYAEDKIVIALDPGHGGAKDPGTCYGRIPEKDYTLELAWNIKSMLESTGSFTVHMTRTGDEALTICQRGVFANSVNADIIISLHFNGDPSNTRSGTDAFTSVLPRYEKQSLCSSILSNLSAYTGLRNNGVTRKYDTEGYYWSEEKQWDVQDSSAGGLSDYYGIPTWGAKFGIPGIIIEHGYFTSASDRAIIFAGGMIEKMARADADAIISYYTGHNHTYAQSITDFPSNCVFDGKASEHCTVCGHRRNVTMLAPDKENHFYISGKGTEKATCTTDGIKGYICRISANLNERGYDCEVHTKGDIIEKATGHNYILTDSREVTHTENGYQAYTCTKCGESYTSYTYAEGHTWEKIGYIQPTCTKEGGNILSCSVCGEECLETEYAYGHSWLEIEYEAPSCTSSGSAGYECGRCGEIYIEEIAAKGHNPIELESKEADCSDGGYTKYLCKTCGEEYYEYTPRLEHTFETVETFPGNCTEDGYILSVCSMCGEKKRDITVKATHDRIEAERKEAGCEEDGYIVYSCSKCQDRQTGILLRTHHNWNDGEQTERGFLTNGKIVYTCKNDPSHIKTEIIPSYVSEHKEPICIFIIASAAAICAALLEIYLKKQENSDNNTPCISAIPSDTVKSEFTADSADKESTPYASETINKSLSSETKEKAPVPDNSAANTADS